MGRVTQIIGGVLFVILIVVAISVGYFNIDYINRWSDTVGIIIVPSSVIAFLLLLLLSFKLVLPKEFFVESHK